MMRSMYSGVSGLKNHQTRMDVIGNNIANVNTTGFKKSRVVFKDVLYQNIRGASAPTDARGGTNPTSIGMGVNLASIDQIHTGAPTTTTGKLTDVAIDGNGYFVVNNGETRYYTRAGSFDFDKLGNLYSTANGYKVQGWMANAQTWDLNTNGDPTSINIVNLKSLNARATTEMLFTGNLDSGLGFVPARNEWQTLTFSAIPYGGTAGEQFTLTFDGLTTAAIAIGADATATATNIQAALEALPNIGAGNVAVTWDAVKQRYDIKFQGVQAALNQPDITFQAITDPFAGGTASIVAVTEGQEPTAVLPRNEVQSLDLTGSTADTFTLSYGGVSTAAIAYNASLTDIQAALDTIPALRGNVTVTQETAPGTSGGKFTIEFNTALAGTNVDQLEITNNAACAGTVLTTTQGQAAGYPEDVITGSKDLYDSQGNKITVHYRFFKYEIEPGSDPGATPEEDPITRWACDLSTDPLFEDQAGYLANSDFAAMDIKTGTVSGLGDSILRVYNIEFDENGNISDPDLAKFDYNINRQVPPPGSGTANISCAIDLSGLNQRAGESSAWASYQDGYQEGNLTSYSVGTDGSVIGVYDNGQMRNLAKVALASFENPAGLQQVGGTMFMVSTNSGDAHIGAPGSQGLGTIIPSNLEMSNVDLSEEFTDMIITQRGFQANSRIITTSDEMLQELVNLKR